MPCSQGFDQNCQVCWLCSSSSAACWFRGNGLVNCGFCQRDLGTATRQLDVAFASQGLALGEISLETDNSKVLFMPQSQLVGLV